MRLFSCKNNSPIEHTARTKRQRLWSVEFPPNGPTISQSPSSQGYSTYRSRVLTTWSSFTELVLFNIYIYDCVSCRRRLQHPLEDIESSDFYIFWCVVLYAPVPRNQVVVKRDEKKIRPFPRRVKIKPAAHCGVGPHSLGITMLFCLCVYIHT
uniref:Uncharacterized protein n=1 Tax=Sipha flava TaxID=143950 RepID=A0A2S2QE27_9HEMI